MKRQALVVIALISLLFPLAAVQAQSTPAPSSGGFPATVIGVNLRLRRAPRLTSSYRALLQKGEVVQAVARDRTGAWLLVLTPKGAGWVDRTWLAPSDKPYYLPVSLVYPPFISAISSEGVNVRTGPKDEFPVITVLPWGVEADVIAVRRARPVWYKIELEDNTTGWVYSNAVFPPGNLKWTPDDDAGPIAQIATYNLKVHTNADLNSTSLGDVRLDSQFAIIGRDDRGNWLQIRGKFGTGWIWANFAIVLGDLANVPITAGNPGPTILQ